MEAARKELLPQFFFNQMTVCVIKNNFVSAIQLWKAAEKLSLCSPASVTRQQFFESIHVRRDLKNNSVAKDLYLCLVFLLWLFAVLSCLSFFDFLIDLTKALTIVLLRCNRKLLTMEV